LKAETAAALITDHERKAVVTRIPYLDVFDRSNDATELHDTPQKSRPAPHQVMQLRMLDDRRPIRNFEQNAYILSVVLSTPSMSWSQKFDEPIALANVKPLRTLRDAGKYVTALS
jgi:hypothetical protein